MISRLETKHKSEEEKEEKIQNITEKNPKIKQKILLLEIITSNFQKVGKKIKINPEGYNLGLRKAKDGITIFGYEEPNSKTKKVRNKLFLKFQKQIDYIIKPKEDQIDDRFIGQHFRIKYNKKNYHYYIKDLGKGFGTFVKMNKIFAIKDNFLISIGGNYIVITLGKDQDNLLRESITNDNNEDSNEKRTINFRLFSGNIKQGYFSFDKNKAIITIGRCSDCDIIIDDYMLSRYHCTIFFKNNKWFISDGLIKNNDFIKPSTNGTWLYAFEDTIIDDKMIFKSNNSLFICNFEK